MQRTSIIVCIDSMQGDLFTGVVEEVIGENFVGAVIGEDVEFNRSDIVDLKFVSQCHGLSFTEDSDTKQRGQETLGCKTLASKLFSNLEAFMLLNP